MTDIDKINAKLDEFDASNGLTVRQYHDQNTALIAAVRVAVEGLERCQKRTLHAKNALWAIAEALEGKP